MKNYVKNLKILLIALAFITPLMIGPLSEAFRTGVTAAGADYIVVEGVAGNDYYNDRQYSYKVNQWANQNIPRYGAFDPGDIYFTAGKSLRLGFTEFGEFATPDYAGIAYGANEAEWNNTESWASSEIDPKYWVQGWLLLINYTRGGVNRTIMAYAMYSNMSDVEAGRKVYSWYSQYPPSDPKAQLTEGSFTTGGIYVLYDSARLVVFRTTVIIHDGFYDEDFAKITFTVVFNKDMKHAIVYKDLKILLDPKVLDAILDLVFSQRFELDLVRKVNPSNWAYIHYYHNYGTTVYQHPLTGQDKYDVLQAYDPNHQYIFFAGYWPNVTEYSVYSPLVPDVPNNLLRILSPGTAIADIPSPPGEPNTPWVIVQWRYNISEWPNMLKWLAKEGTKREIRFVEVVGMTDFNADPHPAKDWDDGWASCQLDTEVWYIMDQVFNPEDLTTCAGVKWFMWVGLGQSAATTDSGGAGFIAVPPVGRAQQPFILFDRNDTMFPWIAPVLGMKGTIPYGLSEFGGNYYESFSNWDKGTGKDNTIYKRTALKKFAFDVYDDVIESPPQPIAGGWSAYNGSGWYWYPSKDPLTERWYYDGTWTEVGYDNIFWSPNGIITLGGCKANGLTRYFNDFYFALHREGTDAYALINGGTVTGSAPTSDFDKPTYDYFPVSTWNSSRTEFGYKEGYAVIALARDINGTRGLSIYGWDGRDTFWAAAWASQYITCPGNNNWIPNGTIAIILKIDYSGANYEPVKFTLIKLLGTITELGWNDFAEGAGYGFDKLPAQSWTAYWDHLVNLPSLPTGYSWWYEKLYTTSVAEIQFDV